MFEQRPIVTIANDKLELTVNERGGAFVNVVLLDDVERLGALTFRWSPTKSIIRSSFLLFYAHTPEGLGKIVNLRLENGQNVIEDGTRRRMTLSASLPL